MKHDIDLSLNPIKPKNLKQYAQMKIAERKKKQQEQEDREKAKRGEPIDVLHGEPAVVRGYKDLNVDRAGIETDEQDRSATKFENALSNARYMQDGKYVVRKDEVNKRGNKRKAYTAEHSPYYVEAGAYQPNTKTFHIGYMNASAHEAGHAIGSTDNVFKNNRKRELNNDRISINEDYSEHDSLLEEYKADVFSVKNGLLNSGIWDGKSKITQNMVNKYKRMLGESNKAEFDKIAEDDYNEELTDAELSKSDKYWLESARRKKERTGKDDYLPDEWRAIHNAERLDEIKKRGKQKLPDNRKNKYYYDPYNKNTTGGINNYNFDNNRFFYTTKNKNEVEALNTFKYGGNLKRGYNPYILNLNF